jgi:hypothetical protein
MTVEELKKEIKSLSFEDQGHLAAFIVHCRNQQDPDSRKELQAILNDKDRSHWLTPDEFEARLNSQK